MPRRKRDEKGSFITSRRTAKASIFPKAKSSKELKKAPNWRNLFEFMKLQVASGAVAMEGDLLGLGLGHGQSLGVEAQRRLVPPHPVHMVRHLYLPHRPLRRLRWSGHGSEPPPTRRPATNPNENGVKKIGKNQGKIGKNYRMMKSDRRIENFEEFRWIGWIWEEGIAGEERETSMIWFESDVLGRLLEPGPGPFSFYLDRTGLDRHPGPS